MPIIFRYKGYRFLFYSFEGSPREPAHVHVRSAEGRAKFWLTETVSLAAYKRYNDQALNELEKIVKENQQFFLEAWNEYFDE